MQVLQVHDPMVYEYQTFLPFEAGFDPGAMTIWMKHYWSLSILFACVYVAVIFTLKHQMQHRHRYDLRRPLTIWNSVLAIFSTVGAARMAPEFWAALFDHGLVYSVCNNSYCQGVTSFWATLFMLSKAVELGDTVFVVLRKQHLIFLHWYHHITVMVYTWYSYPEHTASGRWFVVMNYTVHAFMYSYYACRAMGYRLPKSIPWCITVMQLVQMCVGCALSILSYAVKSHGGHCDQSYANLKWSLVMYCTYFALFTHFFWQHYYTKDGKFVSAAQHNHKYNGHNNTLANTGGQQNNQMLNATAAGKKMKLKSN